MKTKMLFIILAALYIGWWANDFVDSAPFEVGCVWNQIKYGVPLDTKICPKTCHE